MEWRWRACVWLIFFGWLVDGLVFITCIYVETGMHFLCGLLLVVIGVILVVYLSRGKYLFHLVSFIQALAGFGISWKSLPTLRMPMKIRHTWRHLSSSCGKRKEWIERISFLDRIVIFFCPNLTASIQFLPPGWSSRCRELLGLGCRTSHSPRRNIWLQCQVAQFVDSGCYCFR